MDEMNFDEPFLLIIGFMVLMLPIVALSEGILAFSLTLGAFVSLGLATLLYLYMTRHKTTEPEPTDPLTELQTAFANGEISQEEFEQKLDTIVDSQEQADETTLETEDLDL